MSKPAEKNLSSMDLDRLALERDNVVRLKKMLRIREEFWSLLGLDKKDIRH